MPEILPLFLALALIIVAAKLAGAASVRLGQPAVFGELLMGLILGPTVLNFTHWPLFSPESLEGILKALAQLGVILLIFLAGLETDLEEMRRVGNAVAGAAVGGVVLPLVFGTLISRLFGVPWRESLFIGTILTATSISISAQTLIELGRLQSKEGLAILGAAVVDDVIGIIILSLVVALERPQPGAGPWDVLWILVKMALFFGVAIGGGTKVLGRILRYLSGLPVAQAMVAFALAICFFYSWAAEYFGQVAAITGAYIAGVLLSRESFKDTLTEGLEGLTYGLLVPVFFISIGLEANARTLGGSWIFVAVITAVAILTKVVGATLGARPFGFDWWESMRVGVGMISRAEVALIVAAVGLEASIISRDVFSAMVIMALVTTLVTPVLLKLMFRWGGNSTNAGEQPS